jgi:hypothetical protein
MPAAETLFPGLVTVGVSLLAATQFRVISSILVAGSTGAKLRVKGWNGTALVDLAATPGAGDLPLAIGGTTVFGPWTTITTLCRIDNQSLALYGVGGDAIADPIFSSVRVEYK